jgi:hypothetical protein
MEVAVAVHKSTTQGFRPADYRSVAIPPPATVDGLEAPALTALARRVTAAHPEVLEAIAKQHSPVLPERDTGSPASFIRQSRRRNHWGSRNRADDGRSTWPARLNRPSMTVRPAKPPACAEGFVQFAK